MALLNKLRQILSWNCNFHLQGRRWWKYSPDNLKGICTLKTRTRPRLCGDVPSEDNDMNTNPLSVQLPVKILQCNQFFYSCFTEYTSLYIPKYRCVVCVTQRTYTCVVCVTQHTYTCVVCVTQRTYTCVVSHNLHPEAESTEIYSPLYTANVVHKNLFYKILYRQLYVSAMSGHYQVIHRVPDVTVVMLKVNLKLVTI